MLEAREHMTAKSKLTSDEVTSATTQIAAARLLATDADSLTDREFLIAILDASFQWPNSNSFAHVLLERFGSVAHVLSAPRSELCSIESLPHELIWIIPAIRAAAVRLARSKVVGKPLLENWDMLIAYLHAHLAWERVEKIHILFLDGGLRLLAAETHSQGTVNFVKFYLREIVKRALELSSTGIVLVHNHPSSGSHLPSAPDVKETLRIREVLSELTIDLHDHIVIGENKWLSMRQHGMIPSLKGEKFWLPGGTPSEPSPDMTATLTSTGATGTRCSGHYDLDEEIPF